MTQTSLSSQRALAKAILQRAGWFATCQTLTLDRFLIEGKIRTLKRRETLTRRGEQVEHLSLIIDGILETSMTTSAGKRHVVRYLETGQLVNLIPVLDDQRAPHDVIAHVDSTVLLLSKPMIDQTLVMEPGLLRALTRQICEQSRETYSKLSDSLLLTLRQHCVRTLLHISDIYGVARTEGIVISLKLSQEEFASMVGSSRQAVNRELKQLEHEGIIRITYSHVVIVDLQTLKAIITQEPLAEQEMNYDHNRTHLHSEALGGRAKTACAFA